MYFLSNHMAQDFVLFGRVVWWVLTWAGRRMSNSFHRWNHWILLWALTICITGIKWITQRDRAIVMRAVWHSHTGRLQHRVRLTQSSKGWWHHWLNNENLKPQVLRLPYTLFRCVFRHSESGSLSHVSHADVYRGNSVYCVWINEERSLPAESL